MQWGIYGKQYFVRNLHTSGAAAKLTHLPYAFQNIDPVNLFQRRDGRQRLHRRRGCPAAAWVRERGLLGMMAWEMSGDTGALTNAVDTGLR